MKLYILYQTDIYKSRESRICFGVFDSFDLANQIAKDEHLYTFDADVMIEEITLNEFKEI